MTHMGVEVSLARPDERAELWDLYQRTFLDAYVNDKAGITREMLLEFLATDTVYFPKNWQPYLEHPSKKRTVYVARHDGKIVGMVAPVLVEGRHRITGLYVAPAAQHMGIGTELMRKALAHHGNVDVYIGIASHVKGLEKFYKPFGFKVAEPGKLRRYPPDPISYIDMIRPAAKSAE